MCDYAGAEGPEPVIEHVEALTLNEKRQQSGHNEQGGPQEPGSYLGIHLLTAPDEVGSVVASTIVANGT
jgi:hypothetical protein